MARADRAAKNVNRFVRKATAEKIKIEKAKPKIWNGKIIIPLEEWRKKLSSFTYEWKDYYPDKYEPYILPYHGNDEIIKKYQDEWWPGFAEYMESVKDPAFGKAKCEKCILNPDGSPRTTNIRDAIVKTNQSYDGKPLEFPCTVVNRFKCPYTTGDDQGQLLKLGDMWTIFNDTVKYNEKLTGRKHNTYTIDFEKKWIRSRRVDGDIKLDNFEEFFNRLKFPRFETISQEDLYDLITTRDKLKSILEEYLDALLSGVENDEHFMVLLDHLREDPNDFLDVFDKIKSEITLENLQNTDGMTLRDINAKNEAYEKFLAERKHWSDTKIDPPRPEELSGACFSCGELANIRCSNCNIWTCIQHRMDHAVQSHNYKKPDASSSDIVKQ